MREIRGMKRGVKQEPQLNKAERITALEKQLENLQMAGRISQMLVQQLMNNLQNMSKDLGKAFGTINELQYKIIAMQKCGAERGGVFDTATLQSYVEELRLNDFIDASDVADKEGNFSVGAIVQEDSTVIITSTTDGTDSGIFRSRIKLAECGVPALIQGLTGQTVGTKVQCKLNDVEHTVELLAIRNPPPAIPVEAESPVATIADMPASSDPVH